MKPRCQYDEEILSELEKLNSPDRHTRLEAFYNLMWKPSPMSLSDIPPDKKQIYSGSVLGSIITKMAWEAFQLLPSSIKDRIVKFEDLCQDTATKLLISFKNNRFDIGAGKGSPEANLCAYIRRPVRWALSDILERELRELGLTSRGIAIKALKKECYHLRGSQKTEDQKRLLLVKKYLECIKYKGCDPDDFKSISRHTPVQEEEIRRIYREVIEPKLIKVRQNIASSLRAGVQPSPGWVVILSELIVELREIAEEVGGRRGDLIHAMVKCLEQRRNPLKPEELEKSLREMGIEPPERNTLYQWKNRAMETLKEKLDPGWLDFFYELEREEDEWRRLEEEAWRRDLEDWEEDQ